MKDIVAQNQCTRVTVNEFFSNKKCLSQTVWAVLLSKSYGDTPLGSVPQQFSECRCIARRSDHQNVSDASAHKSGKWVIHQRLVINRQKLLTYALGYRPQP